MSLLEQGIQLYPENWKFNYTAAAINHLYKYFDDALKEGLDAQRKAPWRETICFLISEIYKDYGDEGKSRKYEEEGNRIKLEKNRLYE
jgi:hypothetical protein